MILITGASTGIGKFLFERYLKRGDTVFGTSYPEVLETSQKKFLTKVDILNAKEVSGWIASLPKEESKIVLINCAGTNYNAFAHKADLIKWSRVVEVNLIGTFNVIHAVLPIMREKEYGRIINFSSVVAQIGIPGTSAYASSKAGLWGLSRSIAVENAKKGITINNLNLGYFDIGMIEQVPDEFQKVLKEKIPSGKFGNPDTVFNTVNFLIENDYINGTSIDINAGLY